MTFQNYFANPDRSTPINLAVARILLGVYSIWTVVWIDPEILQLYRPEIITDHGWYGSLVPHEIIIQYIWMVQIIVVIMLVAFCVGYRIGATAFISTVLMSYLGIIIWTAASPAAIQTAVSVYFLILFGIFRSDDKLSLDGFRETKQYCDNSLNKALTNDNPNYSMDGLKWGLVLIGLFYFRDAIYKLYPRGEWVYNPETHIQAYVLTNIVRRAEIPPLAEYIITYDSITYIFAAGTIILQLGFLIAILSGKPVHLFFFGLIGLHFGIAFTLNITYVYHYMAVFLLFFTYDKYIGMVSWRREITVVYNNESHIVKRVLLMLKHLDINGMLTFKNHRNRENDLQNDEGFSKLIMVKLDDKTSNDYEGIKLLLRQNYVTAPIGLVIESTPVSKYLQYKIRSSNG